MLYIHFVHTRGEDRKMKINVESLVNIFYQYQISNTEWIQISLNEVTNPPHLFVKSPTENKSEQVY